MNERFDDLIEGINEGSFEVFEQIYVRYYGFVIKLLVHFGVPESALEDLSQEIFIRFYDRTVNQKLKFQSEVPLRAYLHRMAVNSAIDYGRKSKADIIYLDDPNATTTGSDIPVTDNAEMKAEVFSALASLSPHDREIIIQKIVHGLSHKEIARRRGITEGAAKNQLLAAKRRFIECYLRKKYD